MNSPKFSAVLFLLFSLVFQRNIVPSAATAKQTPSPSPSPPCANVCRFSRSDALIDCGYKAPFPDCEVVGCQTASEQDTPGWACAERRDSPTPTSTPTPSLQPVPGAPNFTEMTLLRGTPLQDSSVEPATDESGVMYNVTYDMMLTENGVVSLNSLVDLAEIECNTDGSVRVRLPGDVSVSNLNSMYPERSILVISRELFGDCNIAEDVERPDETEDDRNFRTANDRPAEFVDTYLIIESVSGNPRNALIRGTPTSFFALFDSADISITPLLSTVTSSTVRENLHALSRGISFGAEGEFSSGSFSASVTGNGEYTGEFVSFSASWDLSSVDIAFIFINQWDFSLSLETNIGSGSSSSSRTFELLSIPLYGLPPINFLESLSNSSTIEVELPSLRFGVFFEVPLTLGSNINIGRDLGSEASASYTTSRTEITLFIRGSFLNIDVGATTRNLASPSNDFTFRPMFQSTEEAELEVSAMANIRPQFVVYVPVLSGRVSVEAGVEIQGQAALGPDNAFPPLSNGLLSSGICDECHDIEVTGTGFIRNAGIFVEAGLDIRVSVFFVDLEISINLRLASITLPNNPSFNVIIAQGCFVEPIGEDGPLNFISDSEMCEACPEDMPTYNPTRQECEGECMEPEPFFNQATMMCEACPLDTPTFNEELQICEANCPGGTAAGNDVPFFGSFELGSPGGVFNFEREHFFVRDQIEVLYEGAVIHDTGCVGGSESINLSYNGTDTNVIVRVTPNCAGTSGTAWNFAVSCPTSM